MPASTLDQAVEALDRHPDITVVRRSSLYRTAPWGGVEQNDFLNLGLLVSTTLTGLELLSVAQGIEVACGRTRELRWGPRTLDIDLIRFGSGSRRTRPDHRSSDAAAPARPRTRLRPRPLGRTRRRHRGGHSGRAAPDRRDLLGANSLTRTSTGSLCLNDRMI
jgi:2-amino-4-hydroxy-6-hydroxymethyldihydropteridine diphosphokinase